ncbi:PTS transporter subunit EIIC, partial [Streptomyces sp. NPDC054901]
TYQIVLGPGTVARVTPEFEALVEEGRGGGAPARPPPAHPAPPPRGAAGPPGAPGPHDERP